jgi:aspartate racemase
MQTPGIIGGLGPATTAEFYLELIRRSRRRYTEHYPPILIHSVPVPFALERDIVLHGRELEPLYPLLEETAHSLAAAGADFIALPCNTVHQLHAELQAGLGIPLLNILEITAARCAERAARTTAVLGTRRTLETGLYDAALQRQGLEPLSLAPEEVERCAALIYRLLAEEGQPGDREQLLELIARLGERGADAVILGCTDLQLLVRPGDPDLPVPAIDSVDALLDETVRLIGTPPEGGEQA